ncbi:hypothetical protein NP493_275g01004 [Ridgeia piscesae]|uniref:Thioredoxin domain-containing protein n=1 Tax=Ridgeia piscesae TaxID=27915 RepID=A0AAD9NXD4_RIDPI|nr:hypothetical protein NP493_275g01004 [Ridgeia piscesae]
MAQRLGQTVRTMACSSCATQMRTGVQCGAATRGRLLQADSTGSCRIFRRTVVERPDSMRTPHIKKQDPLKGPPVTWKTVAVTLGVGAVLYGGMEYMKKEKELKKEKERTASLGKAAIGGPWELVDHTGKTVTNKDFYGKWLLMYFGFTHCPDICPDELEKIVEVVDKIEENHDLPDVVPIFVSVDPHRDTVKAVAEYVKEFSPKMVGLTGSEEQVKVAAKNYRVYFSTGPKDDDDDYIVDHSVVTYLLNPDGEFVDYYAQNKTVPECVGSISTHMLKFKMLNKQ